MTVQANDAVDSGALQDGESYAAVFQGGEFVGLVPRWAVRQFAGRLTFGELARTHALTAVPESASPEEAGQLLLATDADCLPVVGPEGAFRGIVTAKSLLARLLGKDVEAESVLAFSADNVEEEPAEVDSGRVAGIEYDYRILREDLLESQSAVDALRRSESLLGSLVENVPATIARLTLDGRFTFVNQTIAGFSRDALLGRRITDFVREDQREGVSATLQYVVETGETQTGEFQGFGAGGQPRIYSWRVAPVRDAETVVGLISVATDITEARRAEQALLESERRLRIVVNNAPVVLYAVDRAGRFKLSEGHGLNSLGLAPGEAVGTSVYAMYRDYPAVIEMIERAMTGEEFSMTVELEGKTFDCRNAPIFDLAGAVVGVIGVATDITDRRQAEEQVRYYAEIVESIQLGLYVHRLEQTATGETLRCLSANPASEQLTGITREEFIGRTIDDVFPNLRSSGLVDIARDVLRTRVPLRVDDFWYGDARVPQSAWEFTLFPLTNQCVGVAFQNVTERRLAAEALSASEELNRLILQAVPAGIVQVDRDGRIVSANTEALEFLGFGVESLSNLGIDDFRVETFWEDGSPCPVEDYPIARCLETNLPQPPATIGVRRPDGTLRWAVFSAVPLPDPEIGDCRGAVATFLDITERKLSEEQTQELQKELAHVSRLSTMGEMASGLAHELNQPLAAIIAYADACQELVESGRIVQGQLIEVLKAVSSQADRAGKIIHRLRKLVKKSEPVRAPITVNDAVREVASLLETEARNAGSYVRLEFDEHLPTVLADFIQIQQVLLNLMRNGLDAMADTEAGNRELAIYTRRSPEGHVEVAIRDRGRGVARENVSRLFEPFFTTKPDGLGMGLSISRTIVEAHGGRMWLTPNADAGMTVRLVLPATDAGVIR